MRCALKIQILTVRSLEKVLLNMSFRSSKMRHVIQHLRHGLVSALSGPGDQTDDLCERRRHQGLARSQKTQEVGAFVRRHTLSDRVESRMAYLRATYHSRHHQPSGDRFTNTVHRRGLPLAVEIVSFERDEREEASSLLTSPELRRPQEAYEAKLRKCF